MGAESFTILALIEARDKASEVFEKIDASADKLAASLGRAAGEAEAAGKTIDESLLQTASGSDALDLATARVDGAKSRAAAATKAQADAERDLLAAQAEATAAADGDTAAQERLMTASDELAAAQKRAAKAAKDLQDAQALQASTEEAAAAKADLAADASTKLDTSSKKSSGSLGKMAGIAGKVGLGLGIAAGVMVKAAGNFQDSTTHLVTDAGESAKNLKMVQAGILQVSTATGTSASSLVDAMYHIESAGYHAGAGLTMLKTAAEGARVGGADLDTVSRTLVGTMNAYQMSAGQSVSVMNQLIATVGAGDMRMQDLASSMSAVTPVAAAAHISLAQVGGAIATMTAQGMSAQQATQDLANTIRNLQKPNATAVKEMQQLGLNVNDVEQNVGKRGLTGTLGLLVGALAKSSSEGRVMFNAFQNSTQAANDANIMIKQMPGSLQKLASAYLNGSVSAKTWRTDLQKLPPVQAHMMSQFAALAGKTHSFNDLLTSGSPAAQTYNAALGSMMGGATGLNTALMLTGSHMATFQQNVKTVQAAADKGGKSVDNWKTIQGTFNQKMATAKTAVENTGIAIGSGLLPAVTKIAGAVTKVAVPIATWIAKHQELSGDILGSLAGLGMFAGAVNLAAKAVKGVTDAVKTVGTVFKGVGTVASGVGKAFKKIPWDSVRSGASTAMNAVKDFGQGVGRAVAAGGKAAWSGTISGLKAVGGAMKTAGIAALDLSKKTALAAASALKAAGAWALEKVQVIASAVAEKAAAAAQWLLNTAMDANPIMLIVIAIAALVAGVIYAYTHFKVFRDIVNAVFDWLKTAVLTVIHFVEDHWRLILTIIGGPLGLAVALVTKYWGDIKRWFMDGVHAVESTLSWFGKLPGMFGSWLASAGRAVWSGITTVTGFFERLPGMILRLLSGAGSWLIDTGKNVVIGLWNGIVSMGSWLWGQIEGWIKDVVPGPILKILNIGSPSKWAHWVGQMTGLGLANGVLASRDKVASASTQLARAVTGTTVGALSGSLAVTGTPGLGAGVPGLVGGAGAAGGVNINLDLRGSQVMSDRDMDTLVNKIGRRLATVTLPTGGVRLTGM